MSGVCISITGRARRRARRVVGRRIKYTVSSVLSKKSTYHKFFDLQSRSTFGEFDLKLSF